MIDAPSYNIYSLGDQALVVDYGNLIDEEINRRVMALFDDLKKNPLPGMIEALPAYSSVTVFYDILYLKRGFQESTAFPSFKQLVEERLKHLNVVTPEEERIMRIPVCYELGTDLEQVAASKSMEVSEVVHMHASELYRVYMIGFLPGFPYMGTVNERLALPRKPKPVSVKAGSVGIAGVQTGIYPVDSPGGWQIIGITPLKLFDPDNNPPALLRPGDKVRFYSINSDEFNSYQGRNS